MSDETRLARSARAKHLIDDPLLAECFQIVRTAIIDRIEATPIRDRDGAHELRLMLKLLSDVRKALGQAADDGKIVMFNQKQSLMDRVKSTLGVAKT